jgi:hypothetical protein
MLKTAAGEVCCGGGVVHWASAGHDDQNRLIDGCDVVLSDPVRCGQAECIGLHARLNHVRDRYVLDRRSRDLQEYLMQPLA